jgi:hypothetical protein
MFRKFMAMTALVSLVVLSACNSVTGPAASGGNRTQTAGGPGPKPPQQYEKQCLSDLRAIEISGPSEGSIMYAGAQELVTWETREICGHYWVDVDVSLDNGLTFSSLGKFKDALSASFKVPNAEGAQVIIRTTLHDREGDVMDEVALVNRLVGRHPGRARNPQDQTPGD